MFSTDTLEIPSVAKKKVDDASTKISREALRLAKTVAAWQNMAVSEWLSKLVVVAAKKEIAKMPKESQKEEAE